MPLWSATHESGALDEWLDWSTAPDAPQVDAGRAHGGAYSARLSLPSGAGAIRLARNTVADGRALPDSAYYSVWFLLPRRYDVPEWWNIFQWKTAHARSPGGSDPTYTINVGNRADGEMYLYLFRHMGSDCAYDPEAVRGAGRAAASPAPVPVGRWFEVVARYDWATGPTGRVTVWQDGARVMDVPAACTEYADAVQNGRQWSVNNYTLPGVSPRPAVIWVDDAAISVPSSAISTATTGASRAADTTRPGYRQAPRWRRSLAALRRTPVMRVRVACTEACRVRLALSLRRIRLGSGRAVLRGAGAATAMVWLSPAGRRALVGPSRLAGSALLVLRATATDPAGNVAARRQAHRVPRRGR